MGLSYGGLRLKHRLRQHLGFGISALLWFQAQGFGYISHVHRLRVSGTSAMCTGWSPHYAHPTPTHTLTHLLWCWNKTFWPNRRDSFAMVPAA